MIFDTKPDGRLIVTQCFQESGKLAFRIERLPGEWIEIFRADYRKNATRGKLRKTAQEQIPNLYSVFFLRGVSDIPQEIIEQAFSEYHGKGSLRLPTMLAPDKGQAAVVKDNLGSAPCG